LGLGGFSILSDFRLVECCGLVYEALMVVVMILYLILHGTVVGVAGIVALGVATPFFVTSLGLT
jgi:hypothetical protein